MMSAPAWQETVSVVHRPGLWVIWLAGILFALFGVGGLVLVERVEDSAPPPGILFHVLAGVFIAVGMRVCGYALRCTFWMVRIRHASPDVLPDVPSDPVLYEGAMVHGRLTHELHEEAGGWSLRPAQNAWRSDKRFLLGFGISFLLVCVGLLTWAFRVQMNVPSWFLAGLCAVMITLMCGGAAFLMIGMILRSGYRRLPKLTVPPNDGDLELEAAKTLDPEDGDVSKGLAWLLFGESGRPKLTIPRRQVVAVQLCPWMFVTKRSNERISTWAGQGAIVVAASGETGYHRLPILLTADMVGAARLMQELALVLNVPYLFSADAAGWRAEAQRAKTRAPLRSGGYQS